MEKAAEAALQDYEKIIYNSWYTAIWSRAKKIPPLQQITKKLHNAVGRKPEAERQQKIAAFTAFFALCNANMNIRGKGESDG